MAKKNEAVDENFESKTENTASDVRIGDDGRKVMDITYNGVKFEFHPGTLADPRVGYILGHLEDPKCEKKAMWQTRMFDTLLGADAFDIISQVAKSCGGDFSEDEFGEFFKFLMEEAQAKN